MPGILDHFFNENLNDEKIDGISPTDGVLKQINFENLFEFEGELNIGNQTEEEEKNKEYDKTILETSQNKSFCFFPYLLSFKIRFII